MSITGRIRALVDGLWTESSGHECANCGTKFDEALTRCPACEKGHVDAETSDPTTYDAMH